MNFINEGRIVVENIPALYDKLSMQVVRKDFGCVTGEESCGCLVTALLCDKVGPAGADKMATRGNTVSMGVALGLNSTYVSGLIAGFDGGDRLYSEKFNNGYDDGAAAFDLLRKCGKI